MNGVDLFTPLLELNPPVLVRANGSPSRIDLAALRHASGAANIGGSGSSSSSISPPRISNTTVITTTANNRSSAFSSLAARKLHDAKTTARQISLTGDVPSHAHTNEKPGRRKGSTGTPQKGAATVRSGQRGTEELACTALAWAADQSSYKNAGSAPSSPSAVSGLGATVQSIATTTTAGKTAFTDNADDSTPAIIPVVAAAAFSGDETVSLNLPYLMRHTQDTGALLDTLFPLQVPQWSAHDNASRNVKIPIQTYGNEEETPTETLMAVQTVSKATASREAVMVLHNTLLARLEARRARPSGLCGIRRSIYTDLFSELVRQVTIEEPVRGLLLARVRENEEHALQVHAALLREGENFAASKLLQDTQNMRLLMQRQAELRAEKTQLEVRKHNLQIERQRLERHYEEERQTRHAQQQEELNYLRRANQQLSLRLKMETERASGGRVAGAAGDVAANGSVDEKVAAAVPSTPAASP